MIIKKKNELELKNSDYKNSVVIVNWQTLTTIEQAEDLRNYKIFNFIN